jgi:MFS family permease
MGSARCSPGAPSRTLTDPRPYCLLARPESLVTAGGHTPGRLPLRVATIRSLRALAVRNFRLYFGGQVVSTIGTWMQLTAQAWLVLQLTNSGAALGVNVALQTLPLLLLGVWAGTVADRIDNRKLLVVTALLGMAQAIGLGVLVATGAVTTMWVYLFSLLFGIVFAFDRPASNALLYELVDTEELPSAIGLNSVIQSAGRLVGPAVGGVLIATVGISSCFFVNAASFLAVVAALVALRRAQMFPRLAAEHHRGQLREGLRYVWHRPDLRLGILVMAVVGTFAYNFSVLIPAMVKFEYGAGAGALGLVQSLSGVGAVIGGLAIASLGRPTMRVLGVSAAAFGVLIGVSAVMPVLAAYAAVWLPLGAASAVFSTVDQMVLQRGADPAFQGRVMSLFTIAWWGTTPVGAIVIGAVIEALSPRAALGVGATAAFASGIAVLVLRRASWSHVADPFEPPADDGMVAGAEPVGPVARAADPA